MEPEAVNAASTLNRHLHRLGSLCHQPKMNFASASKIKEITSSSSKTSPNPRA